MQKKDIEKEKYEKERRIQKGMKKISRRRGEMDCGCFVFFFLSDFVFFQFERSESFFLQRIIKYNERGSIEFWSERGVSEECEKKGKNRLNEF